MNHQNLLLQDDPLAAPDSLEHLPSHHCAAHMSDIEHPMQHAKPDSPDCGACPGGGSICATSCKVAEESPPIDAPDIKARLRNPMGMSQFANRDALYRELNDQRNDAADHIESLESENDRIRAALADKVSAATMLTDISIRDGGMNMSLEGGACHLLAESFADQFRAHGGANYLEVRFATKDGLKLLVTLQNLDGKSPGQLKSEAEQALAEAKDEEDCSASVIEVLREQMQVSGLEIELLKMRLSEASKGRAMYEHVRTLNPSQFTDIWVLNVRGGGSFDDLILADMDKRKGDRA